jgi:hypothetical protein
MLVARFGATLRARLGVRALEDLGDVEVAAALQRTRLLESAMSTLLHGPAPT